MVAILPAQSPTPAAEPIVFLSGGRRESLP
jgi:hypothetical protein